ncbi:uncharacterized protein LOC107419755 [Ziziphus jujuba]|uniref:Nuclear nucleic acid-binding protein C1D n=1 Tax=Ziziphus jujuba TaxID=326968 RepID=A0A6P3ZUW5_ZIZJJ|nr:uncharacterized protein LOC107419755 [Ziziphus jujuba]
MEVSERESSIVPDSAMDSVKRTLVHVEEVEATLPDFLSLSDPEVLSQMQPLQRAQSLLLLAKITSTLFALKLRCTGVHPDDHPVKSELERVNLYQDKLERFIDLSKAPLRPSTTLNTRAATRFIEHSLPDLNPEQKRNMRDISRREGKAVNRMERNLQKKRKYQSTDKQSVQTAAKEFLEKAARELLGDNNNGFKGPLRAEASDQEDLPDC